MAHNPFLQKPPKTLEPATGRRREPRRSAAAIALLIGCGMLLTCESQAASKPERPGLRSAHKQASPPRAGIWEGAGFGNLGAMAVLERKLGLRADAVANGKEALQVLRQVDYDVVLMDCQMPEMDGYEATRHIRAGTHGVRNARIAIIAMTANAMESDREACLAAGMDDYVPKPVGPEALAEPIFRLCQPSDQASSDADSNRSAVDAAD